MRLPSPPLVMLVLVCGLVAGHATGFDVRAFGAAGNGRTFGTAAVNRAIATAASGTAEQAMQKVPELEKAHPEPYVFGVLPAWGLFARHVNNLQVRGVELRTSISDARPAIRPDDIAGARFSDMQLSATDGHPAWSLTNVTSLHARDTTRLLDGTLPAAENRTLQ